MCCGVESNKSNKSLGKSQTVTKAIEKLVPRIGPLMGSHHRHNAYMMIAYGIP